MRPNVDENIYLVSIFLPRCIIQYLLYFQVNSKEKNFFMWLKAIYHDNAWHKFLSNIEETDSRSQYFVKLSR